MHSIKVRLTEAASSRCMQNEQAPSFGSWDECSSFNHFTVPASSLLIQRSHTCRRDSETMGSSHPEEAVTNGAHSCDRSSRAIPSHRHSMINFPEESKLKIRKGAICRYGIPDSPSPPFPPEASLGMMIPRVMEVRDEADVFSYQLRRHHALPRPSCAIHVPPPGS